jgi:hypothetical protein
VPSVIHGDWTHRRGDPGGARSVAAEIDKPRPTIAWSWRPEHGGRVDQLRVTGDRVVVATMMPRDAGAQAGAWEHAVVYVLDARTGAEIARRVLPDPVPVAALVVESGLVHVVATGNGEPIFWYALGPEDLAPRHRRVVDIASTATSHEDVLDAWASPDGGLWLELDCAPADAAERTLAYVFADPSGATREISPRVEIAGDGAPARDACAGGHELFAPLDGKWTGNDSPLPPALSRLDPRAPDAPCEDAWLKATVVGPRAQIRAVGSEGVVCAVAAAEDPDKPERARVEVVEVDRASGVVRWRAQGDRIATKPQLGDGARVARRHNGEILFQSLGVDGAPCTALVCARPDGRMDEIVLGARGRWILDAALGDMVLAHHEEEGGEVQVAGYAIDHEGLLLGRRAVARWSLETPGLGGGTTVYAGAGAVFVRGARAVCALHL